MVNLLDWTRDESREVVTVNACGFVGDGVQVLDVEKF